MDSTTPEDIQNLSRAATHQLHAASSLPQLEAWRVTYLGRKGKIPQLLRHVKDLPAEQRREVGQLGNQIRQELQSAYEHHRQELEQPSTPSTDRAVPAPTIAAVLGHLHPLTQALRQTQRIFADMGFILVEGPNIEQTVYNFDNLNISFEHPARAETDTYYIKGHPDLVLRTHVSTLQTRGVVEHHLTPPFRMMYYGPSYRAEKEDATHGALFQQYEFMVVEENVSLADLKAIVKEFYSRFFNKSVSIRFRPSYFPFVEPGLEVDMKDDVTHKGGWLEMAGAGMVHPNVLRAINVDPNKYQGIALGGGLDRLAMLKFGIPDIRLLYSGDLQFLHQF